MLAILLLSSVILILLTICVHSDRTCIRIRSLSVNGELLVGWRITAPRSFINQRVGLLNHATLPSANGILLKTRGIHMKGMLFAIDIIALDKHFKILTIKQNTQPNTPVPKLPKATRYVLEIAEGQSEALDLSPGDQLFFGDAL